MKKPALESLLEVWIVPLILILVVILAILNR